MVGMMGGMGGGMMGGMGGGMGGSMMAVDAIDSPTGLPFANLNRGEPALAHPARLPFTARSRAAVRVLPAEGETLQIGDISASPRMSGCRRR